MNKSAIANKKDSKGTREAQREQTRARILQSVLEIIVEDGMRGVRHRAVAKQAGVSLGSTTYHFSSIEDLIISAFHHWRAQKVMVVNPFYQDINQRLRPYAGGRVPASRRKDMAAWIFEQSVGYVEDQLTGKRFDRIVELAFYHESIRYPSLRDLLMKVRRVELDYLVKVHTIMDSAEPLEDARITLALFRQLEQSAVMAVLPELDMGVIQRTIHRHLSLCFGVSIPRNYESIRKA